MTPNRIAIVLGLLASGSASHASITFYDAFFTSHYTQIDDVPPATSDFSYFAARIIGGVAGDAQAGTLKIGSTTYDMHAFDDRSVTYTGSVYTNAADMFATYPSGIYSYQITSGTFAGAGASLLVTPPQFSTETPYLNNGSFWALQDCPPATDLNVTWPVFTWSGAANTHLAYFQVYDYTSGQWAFSHAGDNGVFTGDTIPGDVLKSGHRYVYDLIYSNREEHANQGFGTGTATLGFDRGTSGEFRAAATGGTLAGRVFLQGYEPDPIGTPIVLDITWDGGTDSVTTTLGNYGFFAVETPFTGLATVRIKGPRWLSHTLTDVDIEAGQNDLEVFLAGGDIDGDDTVTVFDYSVLSNYFDKSSSDADWLVAGSDGFRPVDADLDGDGAVTVFDYSLLSENFDRSGD